MYRERECVCVTYRESDWAAHPTVRSKTCKHRQIITMTNTSYYDKYYPNIHKHDQTKRSPLELFGAAGWCSLPWRLPLLPRAFLWRSESLRHLIKHDTKLTMNKDLPIYIYIYISRILQALHFCSFYTVNIVNCQHKDLKRWKKRRLRLKSFKR
jgi:hypothetical protein